MSVRIVYKENNEEEFWALWQKYIDKRKTTSRYTPTSIGNNLVYARMRDLLVVDKSFVYVVNGEPQACVFLPIEKRDGHIMVSNDSNDPYVDAPICANQAVRKKVFSHIDEIAKEHSVEKVMFIVSALDTRHLTYNYLHQYGYFDTSILKYVTDASGIDDIRKACRKGHRHDIKKMMENPTLEFFHVDENNSSYELHEEYRMLHKKCAGRVTRPKETFDMQFEKIKKKEAVLCGVTYEGVTVAYGYFDFKSDAALYYSGADDPDYDHLPLYHVLVYSAIEYFKKRGVTYIDLDQPSCPTAQIDFLPDAKQQNIAQFKRGFPGSFWNSHRGIKYYAKDVFQSDMKKFSDAYPEVMSLN